MEAKDLNYRAKLDITEAKKNALELQKMLREIGISGTKGFDGKPLTEYQAGLLKIKQEQLELMKAKAEQARSDRAASFATQAALREERELIKQRNAEAKKRPVDLGDSRAEVAAYSASANAGGGRVATSGRDEYIRLLNQDLENGKISIAEYKSEMDRLSSTVTATTKTTRDLSLSKKELEKMTLQEKFAAQQSAAALKNSVREMNAAKGSIEQRRAALIRLNAVYDNLSVSERRSASGQRLKGIVSGLTEQVKTLEAETGRAQRNVGNYQSAFTKGASRAFGALKQIANILPGVGLAGLIGFAVEPIIEYIGQLDIFKKKAVDVAKVTAASSTEYTKAISDVTGLKTSVEEFKKGTITKTELVNRFNESLGKSVGELRTAQEVEEFYAKKSNAYVKATLLRAEANAALELSSKKASEALVRQTEGPEFMDYAKSLLQAFGQNRTLSIGAIKLNAGSAKNEAVARLKEDAKQYSKLYDELKKKSDIFSRDNGLNFGGKKTGSGKDPALTAAESLSRKLTDLHNASFRKTLSIDDAEIQAVKDKYAKMKEEADKYYKDFGNKPIKINGKNVSKSEVYGVLKADQKTEEDAILEKRAKEKRAKDEKDAKEYYDKLLVDYMDFGQKKAKLDADFAKDAEILRNDPRQLAVRKEAYANDLAALVETNSKKLEEYEKLLVEIENLGRKEALAVIEIARDRLKSDKTAGLVSEKIAKETEELFDRVTKSVIKGTKEAGQELIEIANGLDGIVSAIGDADSAFAKMLSTVSNVVGQVGNIKKGIGDFNKAKDKGNTLGQLGAGLGILGAGISIFKSVFSFFDKSKQREEQAAYSRDLQNKQTEALNKALERQIALLDEVYGTEKVKKYDEAIRQARENQAKYAAELSGKYALTGNKEYDDLLSKLNNGEKIDPLLNSKLEKALRASTTLPKDIASLQRLLDEGKLDANTALIVQNLIKAKETAEQLANNLRAENVGSTLEQVADDFISALTDGTQDFGDTFEKTIQKSLLNGFKGELIRKQLQAFYTQFADLSEGGLTKEEIETLRQSYLSASEKAKTDLEALSRATGIDLTSASGTKASPNSLAGAYSTASQESITLLAGQTSGMRIAQLQTNAILAPIGKSIGDMYQSTMASFTELQAIRENTKRTADNTERLATIETAIVSLNNKVSSGGNSAQAAGFTI